MRTTLSRLAWALWFGLEAAFVAAAPGDLDPGFGDGGVARIGFWGGNESGSAVANQSDGKVLVAGTVQVGGENRVLVVRYLNTGVLDPSFGDGGYVQTDFAGDDAGARGVAYQTSDGKIVVVGNTNDAAFVVRYLGDGALDPSFATGGRWQGSFPGVDRVIAAAVAVQFDGKILVAGTAITDDVRDLALARFLPDGTLDASFALGGLSRAFIDWDDCFGNALVIQPDGMAVVSGYSRGYWTGYHSFLLARFTAGGFLDTGFSGDGLVTTGASSSFMGASALALQISPVNPLKIIAAGSDGYDMVLARYNLNGSLDTTFDADGIVVRSCATGYDGATGVRVLYSGGNPSRILVSGSGYTGELTQEDILLAKFLLGGASDNTFDGDGIVAVAVGSQRDIGAAMTLTTLGRVLVVGSKYNVTDDELLSIGMFTNGTLDPMWNGNGIRLDEFGNPISAANAVAVQPDGKIIAAGRTSRFAIARTLVDGSPDPSFGDVGRDWLPTVFGEAAVVRVQPDGKILTAGSVEVSGNYSDFVIARFNADGSSDHAFSGDGIVSVDFDQGDDFVSGMVLQPDGCAVVTGWSYDLGITSIIALRYLPNGSLDPGFGTGGVVRLSPVAFHSPNDVALQADGKICIVGAAIASPTSTIVSVTRLLPNGSIDPSFNGDGVATVAFGGALSDGRAIEIDAAGRILVTGASIDAVNTAICAARFEADGSLDMTFGDDGRVTTPMSGLQTLAMVIRPLGGCLVLATTGQAPGRAAQLVAYRADGNLDPAYGGDGTIAIDLGGCDTSARGLAIDANGNILLAAEVGHLFTMARLQGESAPSGTHDLDVSRAHLSLARSYPNPLRSTMVAYFESASTSVTEAAILDVAGRKVRTLQPTGGGTRGAILWDGKNQSGQRVAAGVYFLHLRQGAHSASRSVTVVR